MAKDKSWVMITHRVPADFRFDGMVTLEEGKMVS
jgi:ABC-type transport system involved in cytochrome bd biosynthesis fused ATPase/permease subunit